MGAAWGWIVASLLAVAAVLLAAALYRARARRGAAQIDDLTGLYNRRAFYARAAQALKDNAGRAYLLVFCDLDRFKVYNDLFGTQEGDKLLAGFGRALGRLIGPGSLAGRMEADNFVVLCPQEEFDVQRDLGAMDQWLKGYRGDYSFSISAGIYPIEDPGLDVALMCDRAMLASGTVKHDYGLKYAYYDQSLRQRLMLEQQIVGQMAQALEAGEFQVYYQPQYSFSTGQVVGAEALVRWKRPDGESISPGVFIPLFEKNGFITRLDEYVWAQVCRQMRDWARLDHMRDLAVSVNVSRIDIYNPNLPETILRLAGEYGVPVSRLRLEITESAYVDNPVQLVEVVERLKGLGFYIEMDDFGSGYSSLNTLKDVPVDLLKLDLRFLAGQNNAKGGNILSSVVRMAHWLSLPVVAEGVETRSQAEYLLSIGCDYMQGFYFARPMPAQQLEEIMRAATVAPMTRGQVHSAALDANQFWNPDSQATLIFNSYVGGAAIFEYSPGRLEALRVNEQYLKVVHMDRAEYQPYRKNVLQWFYEEGRAACEKMLDRAAESGEGECELHFRPMSGKDGEGPWVHMRVRLLSKGQTSSIFYALLEETTRQRALSEQLGAIMKSVPGGIAMYQVTDKVRTIFFNDTVAQLSGMTREEYQAWAGEDALVAVHPDDREMVAAKVRLLTESSNPNPIKCTYRVLRKGGGFWWAQLSASATHRDGEGVFASAIYLDVSDAVESRKRSQQRERTLWRLYDTVPCGIVRYDMDRRARLGFINRTGLKLLGYESQEAFERATGGSLMAAVYSGDSDYCRSLVEKMASIQGAVDFEHRVKRPDGQVRWIRGSSERVTDEEGGAIIQSVFYDCTLERLLQKERAISQYGKLLFSVFDEVFQVDYASRTCRTLFIRARHDRQPDEVRSLDEALDHWIDTYVHPCDRERVGKLLRHCPDGERPVAEGEVYRLIAEQGEIKFCQVTILRVDSASALICHKDVSGRVQAEQALKENARLLGAQQEQERYRIIVEQTGAAVVEWNRAQRDVYRSPSLAAYALSRVKPQDMFKLKVLKAAVHPADMEELLSFWQLLKDGAAKAERLIRLRMTDESYRFSKVSAYIMRDQAGAVSRIIGTITDIEDAVSDRREKEALAERMENIIASLPVGVGIYELGEKAYPRFASDRLLRIFGYQRGEMDRLIRRHLPLETRLYPDGGGDLTRYLEAKSFNKDFCLHQADGRDVWVRVQGSLKSKDGQALCYAVFSDITGEVRCRQARIWQDERFRIVNRMNQAMIFDYEPAGDRLTFYPHGNDSQGREHVLEKYLSQFLPSGHSRVAAGSVAELSRAIRKASAGQLRGALEFEADLGAGPIWYRAGWVGVKDGEGRVAHVVGRVEDIRRERALRRKAEYDQVTGLYNRATTMEWVQRALSDEALRATCVFAVLDVDNFKEINDTYGHLRGDQLLRAIAQLMKGRFRACDVAGRVGGDEFVLLLKQISLEMALKKLRALAADIYGLTAELNIDRSVSLSIGVYPVSGADKEPAQVFGRADAALYAAKRQGKDGLKVYRPEMEMTRRPQ